MLSSGLDAVAIRRLLPHRYPILLVDRVLEVEPGRRLVATKAVTCNEPCYAGLDAGAGEAELAYPATLLVESWMQSAGLLAGSGAEAVRAGDDQVMLAGSLSGVEFHSRVYPGDLVRHEVVLSRAVGETLLFEGSSSVGDDVVVTVGRCVLAYRSADQLRVPE
ncbi:beta-hydroxyacyl-ACP dehydratase [Micromonospora sp. WMMD1120]|uniref:3-hydroxyacyl-ACP dehydratase FabZ family protein n=1 Tax=Micromonospora sp. WMMD1120 TaxID=3016106 RepID=UPI002417C60A|nr:beta-hydroxyacyl-ACP dehydratase [Micromonospora sp. WMMD1120]MDG4810806.1 beta-hydroxyacyl-ACP dehydratase [Micromonospora sp. WMMD1120]